MFAFNAAKSLESCWELTELSNIFWLNESSEIHASLFPRRFHIRKWLFLVHSRLMILNRIYRFCLSAADMARRWCTLEGGTLSFYQSERSSSALGRVQINEVVSLAVSNSETIIGAGYECKHLIFMDDFLWSDDFFFFSFITVLFII